MLIKGKLYYYKQLHNKQIIRTRPLDNGHISTKYKAPHYYFWKIRLFQLTKNRVKILYLRYL